MLKLNESKKGDIFRMLSQKSLYDTGIEFGFDKHYKDVTGVKNAIYKIYKQVCAEPQRYFVLPEVVDVVKGVVSNRSVSAESSKSLREKREEADKVDFKELLMGGRAKALKLVHAKLDLLSSSKKKLDEVGVTALAQTLGILFDKAQIIQGEATENIAMLAKIDGNITPEQAMEAILKSREANQVDKDRTNKKK